MHFDFLEFSESVLDNLFHLATAFLHSYHCLVLFEVFLFFLYQLFANHAHLFLHLSHLLLHLLQVAAHLIGFNAFVEELFVLL